MSKTSEDSVLKATPHMLDKKYTKNIEGKRFLDERVKEIGTDEPYRERHTKIEKWQFAYRTKNYLYNNSI